MVHRESHHADWDNRCDFQIAAMKSQHLCYDSDRIKVRLARIEKKLQNVVTKEDLEVKTKGLSAVLIAHANTTFRWTIGLYMLVAGVLLAVLKLI